MERLSVRNTITGEVSCISKVMSDGLSYCTEKYALESTRRERLQVGCTISSLNLPLEVIAPDPHPFDYGEATRGRMKEYPTTNSRVVTRYGGYIDDLYRFDTRGDFCIFYCLKGKVRKATIKGIDSVNSRYDLFMEAL